MMTLNRMTTDHPNLHRNTIEQKEQIDIGGLPENEEVQNMAFILDVNSTS